MQQIYGTVGTNFRRTWSICAFFLLSALAIGSGCVERPSTIDPPTPKPFEGTSLKLAVANPQDKEFLDQLARSWAVRNGVNVKVSDEPWDGNADIGLIPPSELARWAESRTLAVAPSEIKHATHAYRWEDLLLPYSVRLTSWREHTYALPVIAEGMVLVYRKDLFDGMNGRPTSPPKTWDDLLEYPSLGEKYLPPSPTDPEVLAAEFFSAAACYDRPAVGRIGGGELIGEEFVAFQFDPKTGNPRLDAPSFQHVAKLFQNLMRRRCAAPDAVTAFQSGEAKVGILTLAELHRLGPDLLAKLSIEPLPGARRVFDASGNLRELDQQTINRVPYIGWGGRLGVVSAKCANPAAAWDFLIDVGLPERAGNDIIANARWGAGPYRNSQLEVRARPRWFAYGLSAIETDRLVGSLRDNIGPGILNYRVPMRTPNQHELAGVLDRELRKIVDGKGSMIAANAQWNEIIQKMPSAEWRVVARASLGLSEN